MTNLQRMLPASLFAYVKNVHIFAHYARTPNFNPTFPSIFTQLKPREKYSKHCKND
jgi:hypothetical protein